MNPTQEQLNNRMVAAGMPPVSAIKIPDTTSTTINGSQVGTNPPTLNLASSSQTPIPNVSVSTPSVPAETPSPLISKIEGLVSESKGKATDLASSVETATNPYAKQLNELNTQIAMHQATSLERQQKALQSGETQGYALGEANVRERTDAIEALKLSALAEGMRGNIALAEGQATRAINAKYAEKDKEIEIARNNIINNYDKFTAAEKKRADATLLRLDKDDAFVKAQKEEDKEIQKIGLKLAENGADMATVQKVLNTGSVDEAIALAGSKLQDPKLKLELEKIKLDMVMTRADIAYKQKATRLLGEPTVAERKEIKAALREAEASIPVMQDKVTTVDLLSKHSGLFGRVGTGFMSRTPKGFWGTIGRVASVVGIPAVLGGAVDKTTGRGQDFAGGVHKLTAGLTLQSLIDAKARGATFGALSEGELGILSSSATALNDWEIKDDKGKGTGYWNIDEKSFKKELKTIQDLTRKALLKSQGTLQTPEEKAMLDAMFEEVATPQQYY